MKQRKRDTAPIASELVKTDPDFEDLVSDFVQGLSVRLATLQQAARGADFALLRTAAHQLKGAAGGYGYPQLTEVAGRLEQHAISQALHECQNSLSELGRLISRVVVKAAGPEAP